MNKQKHFQPIDAADNISNIISEKNFKQDHNAKRFKAHIYTTERISLSYLNRNSKDLNGFLFSQGIYRTHISAEDLPQWYVNGLIYKTNGYISAKGTHHLIYKPCFMNHLYKDDLLFISYEKQIICNNTGWPEGYDESISGHMILLFIDAVKKYSDYDTSEIEYAIKNKRQWYFEHYPDSAENGIK